MVDMMVRATDEVGKDIPRFSVMRAMRDGYLADANKKMMVGLEEGITYFEAYHKAAALARYLRGECGVKRGSTVAFSAPNITEYPLIVAAVQYCGARLALLSGTAECEDMRYALTLLNPDLVIVADDERRQMVRDVSPCCSVLTVASAFMGASAAKSGGVARGFRAKQSRSERIEDDPEVVLFSSGSTGKPKAIVHRSSSLRTNALALDLALRVERADVLFVPVPFAHVYGILGIYAALLRGATLVSCIKYRPEVALSQIHTTRSTVYFGVSTMYLRELRVNQEEEWDISSLRVGLVAGACCPETVFLEYEARYGCRLMQSYGMTETAATLTVSSLDYPVAVRARSVGVPIEGVELKLASGSNEILCKTPSSMIGILGEDGRCHLDFDEEGWIHTGDVGAFDAQGRLAICGRIKDMIIRGGINIYPAEVENLYHLHSDVAECCLVGFPDPDLGERTCLCTVLKEKSCISPHDLRRFAQGRIEKCKIPDIVLEMEDFPRLANGKIDKQHLRDFVEGTFALTEGIHS